MMYDYPHLLSYDVGINNMLQLKIVMITKPLSLLLLLFVF